MEERRVERDSMGEVEVPKDAYWGAHTQRALENFDVSPYRIPPPLIRSLALIKWAAAEANLHMGELEEATARAVIGAAKEMMAGRFDDQFPVDLFQTGSGTSWNMNVNEVIARRASELRRERLSEGREEGGGLESIHPNDIVNSGQSSNDVIPSAINIASRIEGAKLLESLRKIEKSLEKREADFAGIVKLGRTHLQDAVPMTLGQELSAWREQLRRARKRLEQGLEECRYLPLGGTALGTGINSSSRFAKRALQVISRETGLSFGGGRHRFAGISARDESLALMGNLNEVAVVLNKIAQDLRILSGGPRGGLGEIRLPPLQPGSSIMPGKVNPVIPEMVLQASVFVMGKHTSLTLAAQNAPLQLNIMQPLIAHELLESIELLVRVGERLRTAAIEGMEADEGRCRRWVEESLALVTPLAKRIGYDRAAELAHRAFEEERPLFDVVRDSGYLSEDETRAVLDPSSMVGPF